MSSPSACRTPPALPTGPRAPAPRAGYTFAGAGAGKSAIAAALARRGLVCIDDDEDPCLARFVDFAGAMVAEEPAEPDFAWLYRHRWEWDPARLDEWGRAGDSREYIRRLLPGYQDRLRAFGAIAIDARQPLDQVIEAIFSRSLASATPSRAGKPGNHPGSPATP